jgi:MarR family 2-MHQ and catechol resistance regulon transcriptional repressor
MKVLKASQAELDNRTSSYRDRMRQHGQSFREFHWPSVEILFSLIYTYDVITTQVARRLSAYDLSLSAFNILVNLSRSENKGCALCELSRLLLVSRANITGLIDSLVAKGLVERLEDQLDRRVRIARITDKGERLLNELLPGHFLLVREMLSGIDEDEMARLNELLAKMRLSAVAATKKALKGSAGDRHSRG